MPTLGQNDLTLTIKAIDDASPALQSVVRQVLGLGTSTASTDPKIAGLSARLEIAKQRLLEAEQAGNVSQSRMMSLRYSVSDLSGQLATANKELEDNRPLVDNLSNSWYSFAGIAATATAGLYGIVKEVEASNTAANNLTSAITGLNTIANHFGDSANAAQKAAEDLASDGLMTVTEAATGLKNLLSTGFSLPQAIDIMNRFKDTAAFGRQASLGFGEAIDGATEGIKNGNSVLSDNAGMTKNLSLILEEAGYSANDLSKATSDAGVRQALFTGIMKETNAQVGDAAKYAATAAGQQAKFSAETQKLSQAFGKSLQPVISGFIKDVTPIIEGLTKWISAHRELTVAIVAGSSIMLGMVGLLGLIGLGFTTLGPLVEAFAAAVEISIAPAALILAGIPIVIGLIVTALVLLQEKFNIFGKLWKGTVDVFKTGWSDIKQAEKDALDLFGKIVDYLKGAWQDALTLGKKAVDKLSDAFDSGRKFVEKHQTALKTTAIILGTIFGPALIKAGITATVTGIKIAASGVAAGAGWVAGAVSSAAAWSVNTAKAAISAAVNTAKIVAQAAISGAAWVAQAAKSYAAWALNMGKTVVLTAVSSTKMALSAADTGWAWIINAARVSTAWVVTELPKIVVGMAVTAAQSVVQASIASATWVVNAGKASFAWVITELPKIVWGFAVTSGQAVAQATISSTAWIGAASKSAVAWVVTQLPRIVAAFVATAAASVAQAAVAAGAWVAAAATSSASWAALRALIASPVAMGAIAVAGALADLALVMQAINSIQSALKAMDDAAAAKASSQQASKDLIKAATDAYKSGKISKSQYQSDLKLANTPEPSSSWWQTLLTGKSYSVGGFTGVGGINEVAGVVHKGEYVVPQSQVDQRTGKPKMSGSTVNVGNITINNNLDQEQFLRDLGWRVSLS